jgi:hypothetical protein
VGCSVSKAETSDAATASEASATAPDASATLLDGVAAIVVPNCAVGGCHDAQTKEHGMDLSTAASIYDAWVNKKGLDHCRNALRMRVVPGSAEGSYVMVKITGAETCDLSQRMPPPPRMALSSEQIDIIRAWISAGAPVEGVDAGSNDGNGEISRDSAVSVADGWIADVPATTDADPCGEAGSPKSDSGPKPWSLHQLECTATQPCPEGMICVGAGCDDGWECFAHTESPGEHPCPTDYAPYCGCDGVTFMAIRTCPDRPYDHEGSCEDGVTCDPAALRCSGAEPPCPDGEVRSVVGGHYGVCVPIGSCHCDTDAQCPHQELYSCDTTAKRCQTPSGDR